MSNYSTLYWLSRLDALSDLFMTSTILGVIIFAMYFIIMSFSYVDCGDTEEYCKKFGIAKKVSIWMFCIGMLGITFIPTKNEIIFIYAGGKTMSYAQSDTSLSKLPYQTTQIISEYLDKQINELKEENTKK